jgi:hypothetical protein
MELGNAAEWVAAIFTGGGLIAAAYQLRQGRAEAETARQREYAAEDQRREAMAQAVGVTASWQPGPDGKPPSGHDGLMPVRTEVLNAGQYPISGAVLTLGADDYPMEVVYGTILPGQHIKENHKVRRQEVVLGELMGGVTLLFTDVYGNHWARSPHSLERRDQPARLC